MGDILIIGGGFAGLEAARILSRSHSKLNGRRILLVDAKKTFDFLPVLPDVIGRRIQQKNVLLNLGDYLGKLKVNFEQAEVAKIDCGTKEVFLKGGGVLSYEYLIIACGSETNFYGSDEIQKHSLKLDNVEDAMMISNVVSTYPNKKIFIVGGGYTGIEVASNLAVLLRRRKIKKYSINVIERSEDILGALPEWIKDYCRINLAALRVNLYLECSVKEVSDRCLKLSNGLEFEDYLIIWAAGVRTPSFVRELKFEKDGQGRLSVDGSMRFDEGCFVAGDAACFKHKGKTLRMSVQFSIYEARIAAKNILRQIAGQKQLLKYRPLDLGWLIPMANRKAPGKILFFRVWGVVGWFLHYKMCMFRTLSLKNRLGIFYDAFLRIVK